MINTNYNTYNALNSYASSTGNTVNRTTNNTLGSSTKSSANTNDVAVVLTIHSQASGKAPVLKKGSRGAEVTNLQRNQAIENALKGTKTSEVLKKGSRGREVETLQKNLTKLGYDTKGIDGVFGDNTEAAVRRFQKAYGLSVDGIVGKDETKNIADDTGNTADVVEDDKNTTDITGDAADKSMPDVSGEQDAPFTFEIADYYTEGQE